MITQANILKYYIMLAHTSHGKVACAVAKTKCQFQLKINISFYTHTLNYYM